MFTGPDYMAKTYSNSYSNYSKIQSDRALRGRGSGGRSPPEKILKMSIPIKIPNPMPILLQFSIYLENLTRSIQLGLSPLFGDSVTVLSLSLCQPISS